MSKLYVDSAVSRKQIGIHTFPAQKKSNDEVANEECNALQEIILSKPGTYIIVSTKSVGKSCHGIISSYLTNNWEYIYYYTKYVGIKSECKYKFSIVGEFHSYVHVHAIVNMEHGVQIKLSMISDVLYAKLYYGNVSSQLCQYSREFSNISIILYVY